MWVAGEAREVVPPQEQHRRRRDEDIRRGCAQWVHGEFEVALAPGQQDPRHRDGRLRQRDQAIARYYLIASLVMKPFGKVVAQEMVARHVLRVA